MKQNDENWRDVKDNREENGQARSSDNVGIDIEDKIVCSVERRDILDIDKQEVTVVKQEMG